MEHDAVHWCRLPSGHSNNNWMGLLDVTGMVRRRPRRVLRKRVWSVVLVAATMVGACSRSHASSVVASPLTAQSPASTPRSTTSPTTQVLSNSTFEDLRQYSLELYAAIPPEEDVVVWRATQTLIAECMRLRGFKYVEEPYPEGGNATYLDDPYPPFELLAAHGYLWQQYAIPQPAPGGSSGANPDQDPVLGGCYRQASDGLSRVDLAKKQQVFFDADADINSRLATDPRVVTATQDWSACMRSAGLDTQQPSDAFRLAESSGNLESSASIAIAVRDMHCQQQVHLGELRRDVKREMVVGWLEAQPTAISELNAAVDELVRRASTVSP